MQQHNEQIDDWLEEHQAEVHSGEIAVFVVDECHLKGGDICGYGWGERQQRREVNVFNYRDSQTYYGAMDCVTGELILSPSERANGEHTVEFVERLRAARPGCRILLVWDGASYHRAEVFRRYLSELNRGEDWRVHCLRFAPYAPSENPIENIWGQAKQFVRQMHQWCRSFKLTRQLFEVFINCRLFTVPDLSTYDAFSSLS